MNKMFVQPLKWGFSHSRVLSKYLVTVLPATFLLCSWKGKDQLKLTSPELSRPHKAHSAPLENEVIQEMTNILKKSQSKVVTEHNVLNSNKSE